MPIHTAEQLPKYRKHRASGQAVVTLNGHDHYLGPHGTRASRLEYDRLIAEWLARGRTMVATSSDITIVELLAAFRRHAVKHYRKDNRPTGETHNFDYAIVPLRLLYGREPVRDFGPLKLKVVQTLMVKGYNDPRRGAVNGLSRGVVNSRIARIKRIFRWAVSEELAPPSLAHALDTVQGLQLGRCEARETKPVGPVEDWVVDATLPFLPTLVADMVRVQRLTGCRPGEICHLRPCDVDRSGEVWTYRPCRHKTQHHGRERIVFIGPQAQQILTPYLLRPVDAFCFTPAESEQRRKAEMRAARKTPVQPSQRDRSNRRPEKRPGCFFVKDAYGRAVRRASDLADRAAHEADPSIDSHERIVERWAPNRLRHSMATQVRRDFGIEAAQVALGHARANITQVYALRNEALGVQVAKMIG